MRANKGCVAANGMGLKALREYQGGFFLHTLLFFFARGSRRREGIVENEDTTRGRRGFKCLPEEE